MLNKGLKIRCALFFSIENFSNRLKLRGGVYFVQSLPKTNNGKLRRMEITDMAAEIFRATMHTDPDIQLSLSDIPEEIRNLIDLSTNNDSAIDSKLSKI